MDESSRMLRTDISKRNWAPLGGRFLLCVQVQGSLQAFPKTQKAK